MTKYLIFALIFLAPLFALAEGFDRDLQFGMQNNSDVIKLQELLTDKGLYSGPISGNYFSLTLKAVKKFQAREGIKPASGYFGLKTRTKANSILAVNVGESKIQASTESVTPLVSVSTVPAKTENTKPNVASSIVDQIAALQRQLDLLLKGNSTPTINPTPPVQTPVVSNPTPVVTTNPIQVIPPISQPFNDMVYNALPSVVGFISLSSNTKEINGKGRAILTALVKDTDGQPLLNQKVIFGDDNSSITVISDNNGIAKISYWSEPVSNSGSTKLFSIYAKSPQFKDTDYLKDSIQISIFADSKNYFKTEIIEDDPNILKEFGILQDAYISMIDPPNARVNKKYYIHPSSGSWVALYYIKPNTDYEFNFLLKNKAGVIPNHEMYINDEKIITDENGEAKFVYSIKDTLRENIGMSAYVPRVKDLSGRQSRLVYGGYFEVTRDTD